MDEGWNECWVLLNTLPNRGEEDAIRAELVREGAARVQFHWQLGEWPYLRFHTAYTVEKSVELAWDVISRLAPRLLVSPEVC